MAAASLNSVTLLKREMTALRTLVESAYYNGTPLSRDVILVFLEYIDGYKATAADVLTTSIDFSRLTRTRSGFETTQG